MVSILKGVLIVSCFDDACAKKIMNYGQFAEKPKINIEPVRMSDSADE